MTITETLNTEEQQVADLVAELLAEFPPKEVDAVTFLGAQFDKGLAWVHFPEGCGGLGLNPKLQKLINERIYAQGAPNPVYRNPIGHGMTGPTVAVWGSEAQKQPLPAPAVHRRGDLVPAVQRARQRVSDFAGLSSKGVQGRRRVGGQRPEGVDDARPPVALGPAGRAHQPRGREARRPHRLRGRHAGAGCRRCRCAR
jgi:hypothetical protein